MDIHWNHLNICGSILVDFVFKILLKQVVCITFYDFFYINSCKASIFHSLKQYPAQDIGQIVDCSSKSETGT